MLEGSAQILTVDDDPEVCRLLARVIKDAGYRPDVAYTATEMWRKIDHAKLILLDVNLEGANGVELARQIRARDATIGIIMVTGKTEEIDRIVGLEVGADDYVCKPFSLRELAARIHSVMRRLETRREPSSCTLRFASCTVDLETLQVQRGDETVELTGHELRLLSLLAERPNRVFTREDISRKVSAREWYPADRSVDVLVSKLRKKLEGPDGPPIIRSLRGVGYQFCAEP